MRSLNMNDLPALRFTALKGKRCIGKGEFASVYGLKEGEYSSVTKVTVDQFSYFMLADGLFQQMRASSEMNFPRLIEDFGEVGTSNGATAYLVEVERLVPIKTTSHRRLIRYWVDAYAKHRSAAWGNTGSHRGNLREISREFCMKQAELAAEGLGLPEAKAYAQTWLILGDFLGSYGGCLDLKPSNFMVRPSTGDLVFNDVIYDAEGAERSRRARYKMH